jgi:K+-transporting ATPase ATPase C chain
MLIHLRAGLWLLVLTVLICCVLYPAVLLGIGQTFFRDKANGSLIVGQNGKPVGSRLIAQPFAADGYFRPRPSAAGYDGAASGASNWAANNYLLRDRVAKALGPIVKYRSGPRKGKLAGPDIESWFQKDSLGNKPGIVGQWAAAHPTVAQNWVKADSLNSDFVAAWQQAHPREVAGWIQENPGTPEPKPDELAVPFFADYSKTHPGRFPVAVEKELAGGKKEKRIQDVKEGPEIQGTFFDLWLSEHPEAELEEVPADLVMASGSGLDPHITLKNALYQLDRGPTDGTSPFGAMAGHWAAETKKEPSQVRKEIEDLLHARAFALWGGLPGDELINVLEVNLALRERFANHLQATAELR